MASNARAQKQGRRRAEAGKSAGGRPGSKHGQGGVSKRPANLLRPSIASKIRGVERLLSRPNLPEEVRAAQEAKLEQLMQQKANRNMTAAEKKISRKYKMVRFAERVKLQRRLRRAHRELDEALAALPASPDPDASAAIASLRQSVATVQADLDYVVNFPPGEKYVSLLVQPEGEEDLARVEGERARLRGKVQELMAARAAAAAQRRAKAGRGAAVVVGPDAEGGVLDVNPEDIDMIVFDDAPTACAVPAEGEAGGAIGGSGPAEDAAQALMPGKKNGAVGAVAAGSTAHGGSTKQQRGPGGGGAAQKQKDSNDESGSSADESEGAAAVHPDDIEAAAPHGAAERAAAHRLNGARAGAPAELRQRPQGHGDASGSATSDSVGSGGAVHLEETVRKSRTGGAAAPRYEPTASADSEGAAGAADEGEFDEFFDDGAAGGASGANEEPQQEAGAAPEPVVGGGGRAGRIDKKRPRAGGKPDPGAQRWHNEQHGGKHGRQGRDGGKAVRGLGRADAKPARAKGGGGGGRGRAEKAGKAQGSREGPPVGAGAKDSGPGRAEGAAEPKRSRAEGGRKRRKKAKY